jgi:peptidoglycan/LPS O-acetylase OafA/YrhL
MWSGYSIVFPTGILIGLHAEKINKLLKWLYTTSRPVYFGSLFVMIILYYRGSGVFVLARFLSGDASGEIIKVLRPLYLLGSLTMAGPLLDSFRIRSGLLVLLGNYSFEIFLLHQPFMESYDFFLFRKPLWLFIFLYLGLLVFMSHELRVISDRMKSLAFPRPKEPGTFPQPTRGTGELLAAPSERRGNDG